MSFLHQRKSGVSSATVGLTYFPCRKEEIKVCGFIEWIYKREKARIAEKLLISGIIKEGGVFYPSRLQDFPNHYSIPVLHLSVNFLLLLKHHEILL